MEYTEKDIVKHYGLRAKDGSWWTSMDGILFAVTCPRVAEVQLDILGELGIPVEGEGWEVAEVKR